MLQVGDGCGVASSNLSFSVPGGATGIPLLQKKHRLTGAMEARDVSPQIQHKFLSLFQLSFIFFLFPPPSPTFHTNPNLRFLFFFPFSFFPLLLTLILLLLLLLLRPPFLPYTLYFLLLFLVPFVIWLSFFLSFLFSSFLLASFTLTSFPAASPPSILLHCLCHTLITNLLLATRKMTMGGERTNKLLLLEILIVLTLFP